MSVIGKKTLKQLWISYSLYAKLLMVKNGDILSDEDDDDNDAPCNTENPAKWLFVAPYNLESGGRRYRHIVVANT